MKMKYPFYFIATCFLLKVVELINDFNSPALPIIPIVKDSKCKTGNVDETEILVYRGCKNTNCSIRSNPIICEINDAINLARSNHLITTLRICGTCDSSEAHGINQTELNGLSIIGNSSSNNCNLQANFTPIISIVKAMRIENVCFKNVVLSALGEIIINHGDKTQKNDFGRFSSNDSYDNTNKRNDIHLVNNARNDEGSSLLIIINSTMINSSLTIQTISRASIEFCSFFTSHKKGDDNGDHDDGYDIDSRLSTIPATDNMFQLTALTIKRSNVNITNSKFLNNGRHLSVVNSSTVVINDTFFVGAKYGALATKNSTVQLKRSSFIGNNNTDETSLGGGAIYVEGSEANVSVHNGIFVDNMAERAGGTFYLISGKLSVSDSIIKGPSGYSVIGDIIYCVFFDGKTSLHLKNVNITINNNITVNNHVIYCITIEDDTVASSAVFLDGNTNLTCPFHHIVNNKVIPSYSIPIKTWIVSCIQCLKNSYSFQHSKLTWKPEFQNFTIPKLQCKTCPPGAICENGAVVSKNNYWGFFDSTENTTLNFILCPTYYCCSQFSKNCTNWNTCSKNRKGNICGACDRKYSLSLFGHNCMYCLPGTIKNNIVFLSIALLVVGFIFLLVILYLKEIIACLKRFCFGNLKSTLAAAKRAKSRLQSFAELPPQPSDNNENDVESGDRRRNSNEGMDDSAATTTISSNLEQSYSIQQRHQNNSNIISCRNSTNATTTNGSNGNNDNNTESTSINNNNGDISSGILKIIFFFYQVATIIRVNASSKTFVLSNTLHKHTTLVAEILTSVFSMKLEFSGSVNMFCISQRADVKEMLKISYVIVVILLVPLFTVAYKLHKWYLLKLYNKRDHWGRKRSKYEEIHDSGDSDNTTDDTFTPPIAKMDKDCIHKSIKTKKFAGDEINMSVPLFENIPFSVRLMGGFLQVTLVGFSSISTTAIMLVNCVRLSLTQSGQQKYWLYIDGTVECFQVYQYFILVFIAFWVLPFGLALYIGSLQLRKCQIHAWQFIVGLCFPPSCLWFLWKCSQRRQTDDNNKSGAVTMSEYDAMTSRYLLMIVNEPFRERKKTLNKINWEPVLIIRRLLLVVPSILIKSPMLRMYPLGILLLLYAAHHLLTRPFKLELLNRIEYFSLTLLFILTMVNMFWAYTVESVDISNDEVLKAFGLFLILFEMFILTLPFSVVFVIFTYRFLKYRCFKRKKY